MSNYSDYNNFFYKTHRMVYKWWCVIYRPVYKLVHHGYWPEEKNPYNKFPDKPPVQNDVATKMAKDIQNANTNIVEQEVITQTTNVPDTVEPEFDTGNVDDDVLAKANEIMERLAREAAEDQAKKQKEIDDAKKAAQEQQMLASIMNANKVDISVFIEEGKKNANN